MRAPLPPFEPDAWIVYARRAATMLLAGWAIWLLWSIRSWDYGDRFGLFSMFACATLPIVLLVWPGIVWRANVLFSTTTALLVLALASLVTFGSTSTEIVYELTELDRVSEAPPEPLVDLQTLSALLALAFAALVLSLVQQRAQRRWIALGTLAVLLAIELPHTCLLYTSPSPRDVEESRMPSSA